MTASALFAKTRLESLRSAVLRNAQARTGARLSLDAISVTGLRGFRIEQFDAAVPTPSGPQVHVAVPELLIHIDLLDLFYGDLTVQGVTIDNALVRVDLADLSPTGMTRAASSPEAPRPFLPSFFPARLSGTDCTVQLLNLPDGKSVAFSGVTFDVTRVPGGQKVAATLEAQLQGAPQALFKGEMEYASPDEFELELDCGVIGAFDVNRFLPPRWQYIQSGTVQPRIRLDRTRGQAVDVSMEASFENIHIPNKLNLLRPVTGTVSVFADYSPAPRFLSLRMATIETGQGRGEASGSVSFEDSAPLLDLRLQAADLPVDEAARKLIPDDLAKFGAIAFTTHDPKEVEVTIKGAASGPAIAAHATAGAMDLEFTPKDPERFPSGSLQVGRIDAEWDSDAQEPSVSATVLGGVVSHAETGIEVRNVSASVALEGSVATVSRLTAEYAGNTLVGSLTYDLERKSGTATLDGTVGDLEKTPLHRGIRKTEVAGSAVLHARASLSPSKYMVEGDIDAARTLIEHNWFFLKPPGVGITGTFSGEMIPKKSIDFNIDVSMTKTRVANHLELRHNGTRWILKKAESRSDAIDVVTIGPCLRLPYLITGGTGTQLHHAWVRDNDEQHEWHTATSLKLDEINLLPNGGDEPFHLEDIALEASMVTRVDERTGAMTLSVGNGKTPTFGGVWFLPLRSDPVLKKKYPPNNRKWVYSLAAKQLEAPPWKGSDFAAKGYGSLFEAGLESYRAKVGDGAVSGMYHLDRRDNLYKARSDWQDVPAEMLIEHMRFPDILTGPVSGGVEWELDRDDPRTLDGSGSFEVRNGQFSADYLVAHLQRIDTEGASLPPSLAFTSLAAANITFRKDRVDTPLIKLQSRGLDIVCKGGFVTDGDMDYVVEVAVSPETAESIPLLRDNINVQGHRLAQQPINLAFRVTGPTLKPRGELAEAPPVSVTLMAGALEVTSTALEVIDTPRKILIDLIKIGGGIVGPRRQPEDASP